MGEPLSIEGPGGKIAAILDVPSHIPSGGCPVAVLCHGLMDSKEGKVVSALGKALPEVGIASLRFDFDGHGESDGPTYGMTIPHEIMDLKAVLGYVRSLEWAKSVAVCGHSLGGVVAAMTAGEIGFPEISAVLLYAPAGMAKDDALRGYVIGGWFDPDNVPERMPLFGGFVLGRDYIMTARSLPIYETASLYRGPSCIIQGGNDYIVRPRIGEKFHEAIAGSEFILIDGAGHDFSSSVEKASRLGADWLKEKLLQ